MRRSAGILAGIFERAFTGKLARICGKICHDLPTIPVYCIAGETILFEFHPLINTMKKLIATLTLAVLAFAPMAMAAEVTYVAGMTGVV
jgi:hypothetical protein